jgi:hemolysin type calcium-binding protein
MVRGPGPAGVRVCAVVGAVLATLALPAVAGASTIHSPDSGIVLTAGAGEQNDVTIAPSPVAGMLRLTERTVPLVAGFGCARVDERTVDCPPRGKPVTVDLGDSSDTLDVPSGSMPIIARGGDGNDQLLAYGAGPSSLDGGSGDDHLFGGLDGDTLSGGPGGDDLRGDVVFDGKGFSISTASGGDDLLKGGPDSDGYAGGPGFDTVSYADLVAPVTAVLPRPPEEGASSPGQGAEGEGLPQDVEGIIGGSGPDSLTGNRASNRLEGGPGNDTLKGNDGADHLVGGADGDTILARDGILDLISCGPNRTGKSPRRDTLDSDLADGTPPADCETVTQGAIREGPNVRMSGRPLRLRRDGRVGIRLRCPRKLAIGCKGTLRLRLLPTTRPTPRGQASARSSAYRLAAGRSKLVLLRLSRRERAALRRASRSARLRSVEAGEFGRKTTIRTVRLKRSR